MNFTTTQRGFTQNNQPKYQNVGQVAPDNLLNNPPSSVLTGHLPPHGEAAHFNAPSTWRERAECVSTGVRGCSRGFTLIELLVVVLIIGILAAVAVPQYQKTIIHARIDEAIVILKSITDAQELYALEHGDYTNNLDNLPLSIKINNSYFSFACPDARSCHATPRYAGYPYLEFHTKTPLSAIAISHPNYLGKHWCKYTSDTPTQYRSKIIELCSSLGPQDTSMDEPRYWLIL